MRLVCVGPNPCMNMVSNLSIVRWMMILSPNSSLRYALGPVARESVQNFRMAHKLTGIFQCYANDRLRGIRSPPADKFAQIFAPSCSFCIGTKRNLDGSQNSALATSIFALGTRQWKCHKRVANQADDINYPYNDEI